MGRGSGSSFDRARRQSAYRRLLDGLKGSGARAELLQLDRAEQALRPFSRRYAGIQSIFLDRIVGTDSRIGDFDRDFLPQRAELGDRWRRVESAFAQSELAPIVVNQLGDAYFVVDGHHRVAIARQQGRETIDAEVTELRALWHLRADAGPRELIHAEQHRIFMHESGLALVHPDACIVFSEPQGYAQLLENLQAHGYRLIMRHGRALTPGEIAADWYEQVYLATLDIFDREGVVPKWTQGDLFLCAFERRRELLVVGEPAALEDVADQILVGDAKGARSRIRRLLAA